MSVLYNRPNASVSLHSSSNMSRDIALLASVSLKFTEKTLEAALRRATGATSVTITGWNFASGAEEGANYLSIVHRVTVSATVNDKVIDIPIIVKALPDNRCYRKTFRSLDFFRNEIIFYSKVIPAFENFLQTKGACDLLIVPKCLAYCHDGENDFLVLEDMTTQGFTHVPGKRDIWTVDNMKLILSSLAQLHGTALAFRHHRPSEFSDITGDLEEMIFSEKQWQWYGTHYTNMNAIVKSAMTQQYPGTREEKKFNAIQPDELFRRCVNCRKSPRASPIVVNHGDTWAFNCMTRTSDSGKSEAILFDFQLSGPGSPVADISYFIYSCTDKDTRDHYFHDLLGHYHSELGTVVSRLGLSIEDVYPEDSFMKDVKEQFIFGLSFALDILPMMLTTDDGSADIETFTNDEAVDISLMWKVNADLPSECNKRIADVIVHAIQQGFL